MNGINDDLRVQITFEVKDFLTFALFANASIR